MTGARWIEDGRLDPALGDGAVAWLFRDDDEAVLAVAARSGAAASDLADAAQARAGGGAPRLLRRRILRVLAAQALGRHPQSLAFRRDARGAVHLDCEPELFVSAGGRAGWSVVALGRRPAGVDVEETGALPRPQLREWLKRESWAKAHGRGVGSSRCGGLDADISFRTAGAVTACLLVARAARQGDEA